jgi:hypothetical protein
VDSALLRELGERLVGKPHIALAELIKNSYDADAKSVSVRFGNDSIVVADDGPHLDAWGKKLRRANGFFDRKSLWKDGG